ncbi:MAG: LytTR family DNA-binding domain-containing protein [Christensenellaceae bacterium]
MIKIAVCEDNPDDLSHLLDLIQKYSTVCTQETEIKYFSFLSGDSFIEAIERGSIFDIVFLDVLMPGINGIDIAKELRQLGHDSIIIFLSSTKDFAFDAYAVKAYQYLLKPTSKELLFPLLDEAISETFHQSNQYIVLQHSAGLSKILFKKLKFIEVIQKRLYFNMNDSPVFNTVLTLSAVEQNLLADSRFLKPHRSYIVNMDYIDTIHFREICMLDQTKIPISKVLYTKVKEKFINYCVYTK